MNQRSLREARKCVVDAAIRAAQKKTTHRGPRIRAAFDLLLRAVQTHSRVLSPRESATGRSRRVVQSLAAMAKSCFGWLAPIESWAPAFDVQAARSDFLVIASLAEHLFARFPIPRFMTHAWWSPRVDERAREQDWYMLLGRGVSVREIGLPIPLTRSMAHLFRSAPDDLDIVPAVRFAQVLSLGGSEALARTIARTRLGRAGSHDAFWTSAIELLIAHPEIDLSIVELVIDYLHERNEVLDAISIGALFEATPNVRPRDLALASLGAIARERLIREWRALPMVSALTLRGAAFTWKSSPIGGLLHFDIDPVDARLRTWRIYELCSGEELRQEGLAMRHCVATYASKCAAGAASIWSMVVEEDGGPRKRVLTIEVDDKRRICQAKRHANDRPRPREMAVLQRWAEKEGLLFAGQLAHVSQARLA